KGLECHCSEFEKIPIHRRELGMAGGVVTYGVAIGESYITHTLDEYLAKERVEKWGQRSARMLIKLNGGLTSLLQAKIEGKSNERALVETSTGIVIGSGTGYLATQNSYGKTLIQKGTNLAQQTLSQTSKLASSSATRLTSSRFASNIAVKTGVSILTRIGTGAAAGATVGSTAPIVGTIIGAIAGALIAGMINDAIFADEDEQLEKDKAHNAEIERLEKAYNLKIDRINDYLVRNKYIELRILDDIESEILCKEASNLKSSYFKTILLMQSFPNYLDRDKEFYDTLQQKELDTSKDSKERNSKEKDKAQSKEPKITPIANAIPLTIEIEKCYDGASGNLLKNTTIYLYNHRFKRVVAKGQSDERGKLIVHNVYVGKENTID
ncbi:hypothetical protein CQA53_11565, partial [Helicobacter didelphidarum]